eukprot:827568-Rhodomonas_salina.1
MLTFLVADASKSQLPEARDSEVSPRSSPIVLSTNRPQAGERAKERETQRDLPSGGRERERERQRERERSRGSRGEESGGRGTPNPFFETPRIPSTLSVFLRLPSSLFSCLPPSDSQ